MPPSPIKTAEQYLATLSPERREMIAAVRDLILKRLPAGYVELIDYGMLCYGVPLATYPKTHNGHPLLYMALASQKSYCSLHFPCAYIDPKQKETLRADFERAGKKLNMGGSCLHFKSLNQLALPAIAKMVTGTNVKSYIKIYETTRPPKPAKK